MKNCLVIIPVREFTNTKLRLSPVLSKAQRAKLTLALLRKVLSEVERSNAVEAIVVTSRPDLVARHILDFPKTRVIKESKHHGGVNSAMRDGLKAAGKRYPASSVLLIPSDLPFLSFRALDKVALLMEKYDLLISPSSKLDGTSLLAFNLESGRIPFHYDDDSFNKHRAEAKKMKIKHRILRMRGFSFDVDSGSDLRNLMRALQVVSFQELLRKLEERAG